MIWTILKRELMGYFATPVAYVFIVIFLLLTGIFTFYIGGFYDFGQASLQSFFQFHPYLFIFLIPALAMRLWSEEHKSGTIELLMTLPITTPQAVIGKYLAAWIFTGITIMLTFPLWITVNYLGDPDNGVIIASYIGSFLMAGAYLAIGACISALTKNQVIAFVITVMVCMLFAFIGPLNELGELRDMIPTAVQDFLVSLSFDQRFREITRGVLDIRVFVYFLSIIGSWLLANILILDYKKG